MDRLKSRNVCAAFLEDSEEAFACFVIDAKTNTALLVAPDKVMLHTPSLTYEFNVDEVLSVTRDKNEVRIELVNGRLVFKPTDAIAVPLGEKGGNER